MVKHWILFLKRKLKKLLGRKEEYVYYHRTADKIVIVDIIQDIMEYVSESGALKYTETQALKDIENDNNFILLGKL